jgi:hypothetical protein
MRLSTLIPVIILLAITTATGLPKPTVEPKAWARFSPEKCGLSFELPGEPKLVSTAVPEELRLQVYYESFISYRVSRTALVESVDVNISLLDPRA